jgi:hypothetical protein
MWAVDKIRDIARASARGAGAVNAGPAEAETPPPAASVDPHKVAIDKIRETARWLILAFAAIGVALAGTAPLSNLGKLAIDDWRLWLAAGAAAAGLLAIAVAIWVTSNVFSPVTTDLASLARNRKLAKLFNANPDIFKGNGKTLDEFSASYREAREDYLQAIEAFKNSPTPANEAAKKAAGERFSGMAPVVARIMSESLLDRVRSQFNKARIFMFGGALVAGFAIVTFTWAANPPATTAAKTPAAPKSAKLGRIRASSLGPGVTIAKKDAIAALLQRNLKAALARQYVESFSGALEIRTVGKGTRFLRYARSAEGRGSFLTTSRFSEPMLARLALHLPWRNTARCLQRVIVRRRTLVLVGRISQGDPNAQQILILDRKAFRFRKGKPYGEQSCPTK